MRRPSFLANWHGLVITLCAAVIAILAIQHIIRSGELRDAQAAMMQDSLDNSLRQFEQGLERELISLLATFQVSGRRSLSGEWSRLFERLDLWMETSSHSDLVRCLLVQAPDEQGRERLHYFPPERDETIVAEWDGDLARLKPRLERRTGLFGRNRDGRIAVWTLFPDPGAIVRPMQFRISNTQYGSLPPRGSGYLILLLDWDYVIGTMLPEYVQRFFAGPTGQRHYDVAVALDGTDRFLYRSDPSIDSEWLTAADSRRQLRLPPSDRPRRSPLGGPNASGPHPPRGTPGGPLEGPPDLPVFASPEPRRPQAFGRGRLFIEDDQSTPALVLAATHVSGSLAGVVQAQRLRNLSGGLGLLLLLAGAMALIVISAHRAARLTSMQMQFVVGVTHELRTPLAVIRSVGDNLADGIVTGGRQVQHYGELIRDQGRRLSDMVEQTLQLAALESGSRTFRRDLIDPSAAVEAAVEQAQPMIEQAGFTLERGEDHPLPPVKADDLAVQQILSNMLSNAVKYGEPGRWLRVEAELSGSNAEREVQIRVRDRGAGIPAEEADRVFDPYFRGAASGEQRIQGSGLGLKLARDMAVRMGAKLTFRSQVGTGSEFVLHLPVHSGAEA